MFEFELFVTCSFTIHNKNSIFFYSSYKLYSRVVYNFYGFISFLQAREYKRKSVVGLESRLEKLANDNQVQVNVLQQKLNDETSNKQKAEEKLKEMEAIWEAQKSQVREK